MSKIFKNLIFFLLILKILSVPGEEGFTTSDKGDYKKVDPLETCPCDTTKTCEKGCCCDKDCLNFMLNNDFFDDNFECDPESSSSRRIESKLEYCEDYKKSIDDLYNPLVLAFKILKRGFCLFRNNNKSKDEENKNSQEDETPKNEEDYNFERDFIDVPLTLPSGMCLFGSYSIKEYQDYEVTCTYIYDNNNINDKIFNSIINNNTKYNIENITTDYFDSTCNNNNNCALKKMEIFDYGNEDNYTINCYYENNNNNYQDFTFVIKHFESKEDFHKSGNPGYIKGKPILMGTLREESNKNYISLFREGIVFPLEEYQNFNIKKETAYYDNYMDNKLTFEDLIFYKYKDNSYYYNETIDAFKNFQNLYCGMFGNANLKYINDWNKIPIENLNNQQSLLLLGVYNDYGLVNNTQFKIQDFVIQNTEYQETKNKNYFIMKFLKKNDTETDWWFAPGPGFIIRVPKNWMYPFQVGTTTYKTKS